MDDWSNVVRSEVVWIELEYKYEGWSRMDYCGMT